MLPFEVDALRDAVSAGRVTKRDHPYLSLSIYNYSPEVQYSNDWDEVTLTCRGLILDADFNIIARPWKKFFNLGQMGVQVDPDEPVEVMDKADGSLGILYPTDDGYAIATRGSFESTQAIHANALWEKEYAMHYDFQVAHLNDYTFLFEIVFPSNRIVLDYAGMDDLILLGAVVKSSGEYLGPSEASSILGWTGPVVEVLPYETLGEALENNNRPNAEGYVIRSRDLMFKVKQQDYIDLHKLVTNASPKTVWEQLRVGKGKDEIIAAFPDEFHDYIAEMIDPLLKTFDSRLIEVTTRFMHAKKAAEMRAGNSDLDLSCSRKEYAQEFAKYKDAKYFFALLDRKPISDILWKELKPNEREI